MQNKDYNEFQRVRLERYYDQTARWPQSGRHIMAHYDDQTILVYQAYNRQIAEYAIRNGRFGGEFSFSRMSWIKPNFLWMMYRSGWGTKENQEVTLGLRLDRTFFDRCLRAAVPSSMDEELYADRDEWKAAVAGSDVRLQWDPDHDPQGAALTRRAIQLGLRGDVLAHFGGEALREVIDMTPLVDEQRARLAEGGAELRMPEERVYRPADTAICARLQLDD